MSYKDGTNILTLDWPDTPLGVRARNILYRHGLATVGQVKEYLEEYHARQTVPYIARGGIGPKTYEVIKEAFHEVGAVLPDMDFSRVHEVLPDIDSKYRRYER